MSSRVYKINKGMNQPVRFKGLQAQYIWYLGGLFVGLLFLFAMVYFLGLPAVIGLPVIGTLGTVGFIQIQRMSKMHGEHGLMKKMARRSLPRVLKVHSRQLFLKP